MHLLSLSRGLATQQTAERSAMASMMGREATREKNLQAASKKKRRQAAEMAQIEAMREQELERRQRNEDGMASVISGLDAQFLGLLKGIEVSAPSLKSGTAAAH